VPTANAAPAGIATGPGGSLWFTELSGNKIGRVTTGGAFTEFTVPTPASRPYSIAVGADGNLWFTENVGDKIGRITTVGAITEFPLPAGSEPEGIAAGPDGDVWFAESGRDMIGRITVAGGTITEFPLPTPNSGPDYLVAGSDGAFWLTEPDVDKIGRMTTSGSAVDYDVPSSNSDLGNIAAGPDGGIWFSEASADKIGRVDVAAAGTRCVLVRSLGFAPGVRRADLGEKVEWTFYGPVTQSVTDTSGLGLFDSGSRSFVAYYSFTFAAAGVYGYDDGLHTALTGRIAVPTQASPPSGTIGTTFTVTWSTAAASGDRVFDVQIKRPGVVVLRELAHGTDRAEPDLRTRFGHRRLLVPRAPPQHRHGRALGLVSGGVDPRELSAFPRAGGRARAGNFVTESAREASGGGRRLAVWRRSRSFTPAPSAGTNPRAGSGAARAAGRSGASTRRRSEVRSRRGRPRLPRARYCASSRSRPRRPSGSRRASLSSTASSGAASSRRASSLSAASPASASRPCF
jgi:plastocyanin